MTSVPTRAPAREIELALGLAKRDVPALLRHPALAAARRGRARTSRLVSAYFDTADGALAAAGLALRVRRDGARYVQTLKGPSVGAATPALRSRAEYEWPLRRGAIDTAALRATPWAPLLARAVRDGLVRRFTTDFERRAIPVALPPGARALLCVDVGGIRAPSTRRRMPISEIEIELVDGSPASLYAFARTLAADLPLAILPSNKAQRGFELAEGPRRRAQPATASDAALAPDAGVLDALAAVARDALRQIAANAHGVLHESDPEWLHQMRVGTRRLRACLKLVARVADGTDVEPVLTELAWLAGVLGEVRDLDVASTQTLPAIAAAGCDAKAAAALRELARRVDTRRRSARDTMRTAVASTRYTRVVLDAAALADTLGASKTQEPARDAAVRLLRRRERALARLVRRLDRAAPEERHRARIAAKKLRYGAEFFAPLFPRARTQRYLHALRALQQALGEANDLVVAERIAARRGPPAALAAIRRHVEARADAQAASLRKSSKRLARLAPPWRR